MNILLTTPREPFYSPFSTSEKRIPVGLAFLAEQLRASGNQVYIIDNYLVPTRFWETDFLRYAKIDLVGIHANTVCLEGVIEIATNLQYLREQGRWNGKIVLGGPLLSTHRDQVPDWVDHLVIGEGEKAILKIVDGNAPREVECPVVENLDELPLPRFEGFLNLPYDWTSHWLEGKRIITLNTSRGCPFECAFCSVHSIWGRRYRTMSPERVVEWVQFVQQKGFHAVYFREDHFTLNPKRTARFCELILEKNIKIDWICESRVDSLTAEGIDLMARSGCKAVYVGVESGSDIVLEMINKRENTDQFRRAFAMFKESGIRSYASFVVGMPGTSRQDDEKTKRFALEIGPDYCSFNVFVGIPFSPMYSRSKELNLVRFTDYRGLLFLKDHNRRIRQYYGPYSIIQGGIHPLMMLDSRKRECLGWKMDYVRCRGGAGKLRNLMRLGIPGSTVVLKDRLARKKLSRFE